MKFAELDAYYRAEVLYAQVQEILHLDGNETHDAKAIKTADLLLTVAQVDRMLRGAVSAASENQGSESGVLGVTSPQLRRSTGMDDDRTVRLHQEAARHVLLPLIEEKLLEKCTDVCAIVLPELIDRSRQSQSAMNAPLARQIMEVPALIVELQSLKNQRESRILLLKKQLREQLMKDLDHIKAMIQLVQNLLVLYKQQDAPRVLQAKLQWLIAYSRAMAVRAKVLAKQIQVETYTQDRTKLLLGVHEALEERRRRALEEREQLEAKLHLYRTADPEYQAIAREYAFVLQGIDEKRKWIRSLNM